MVEFKRILKSFRRFRYPFKFIFSEKYWMVDTKKHVFPMAKYRMIYENILSLGARKDNMIQPIPALDEDILRVHTQKYLNKAKQGKLSYSEILILEIPFSPELMDFFLLMVGGTIATAENAIEQGLAIHIGGGFHHAFADHGEGFCVFNDVAIALEKMIKTEAAKKVMVVDCDVHQGNGTAEIFAKKDYAFTFSIHQMDIYPANKPSSSLDVGLWSGDGDEKYIEELTRFFPRIYQEFKPDLVFYLAGADPFERDQLGGLKLTLEGLRERDRIVIEEARKLGIPVAVLFAGGYAFDVQDTVAIHMNTIETARVIKRRVG